MACSGSPRPNGSRWPARRHHLGCSPLGVSVKDSVASDTEGISTAPWLRLNCLRVATAPLALKSRVRFALIAPSSTRRGAGPRFDDGHSGAGVRFPPHRANTAFWGCAQAHKTCRSAVRRSAKEYPGDVVGLEREDISSPQLTRESLRRGLLGHRPIHQPFLSRCNIVKFPGWNAVRLFVEISLGILMYVQNLEPPNVHLPWPP